MANAFVEKLRGYAPISAADEAMLEDTCRRSRKFPANYDLILEGDTPGPVFVILKGWACRYKILPGGSRQIISFLMPGDFCDMHVAVLAEMDHSIATLTDATVVTIPGALSNERGRLGLTMIAAADEPQIQSQASQPILVL